MKELEVGQVYEEIHYPDGHVAVSCEANRLSRGGRLDFLIDLAGGDDGHARITAPEEPHVLIVCFPATIENARRAIHDYCREYGIVAWSWRNVTRRDAM